MRRAPVKRGCTTRRSPVSRSITTSFARRQLRTMVASCNRFARDRELTPRRTSRFLTDTFFILRPLIAPSRSRAIVSVSGNSGTARQLTPANVASQLLPLERHLLGMVARHLARLDQTRSHSGDGKHPTAGSDELIRGRIDGGAGLKYHH